MSTKAATEGRTRTAFMAGLAGALGAPSEHNATVVARRKGDR